MSYILDALRKSEQERRHADVGSLGELTPPIAAPAPRTLVWLAASVAALALLITIGYVLWQRHTPEPVTTAAPAHGMTHSASPSLNETARQSDVPPTLKPSPMMPSSDASARDLAQEARVDSPKPKPAPLAAVKPRTETRVSAPLSPVVSNSPAAAIEQVKFLHLMPPEFQRGLPALAVNIHIYAPVENERILYINNRQYQAGEKIRDDIIVEEVVEDGAVLSRNGQRFKLPRPR